VALHRLVPTVTLVTTDWLSRIQCYLLTFIHMVFLKHLNIYGLLTVGYTYVKYTTFRELAVLGFRLSFLGN